jgi:glutamate synthase (NADPH/NADH) large chain
LKALIAEHQEHTQSDVAQALLADWNNALTRFVKVMPVDYKRMQAYMQQARSTGKFATEYEVAVEAFDTHLKNLASGQAASKAVPNADVKLVLAQ